ncbi:MAG: hypothetical protein C0417_00175 [Chlorobiaceae bacterium]|nr:hypothetical protein [Chlorobiaceae bacterium]
MVNPSFHLYQLQKIDLKTDTLFRRLSEIDKIRNDNSSLKALEQMLSVKTKDLNVAQAAYAITVEKVRIKKLKIEQSESSLYSGAIKNPKELQDLQTEIHSLNLSVARLEDIQLQQMVDLEEKEINLSVVNQALEKCTGELTIKYSSLLSEENEKKNELDRLIQEKKVVLDQVSAVNLEMYNVLRKSKNGIAVCSIEDGCCSACGATLTPSDCQAAKSPIQMVSCHTCGRILYAG